MAREKELIEEEKQKQEQIKALKDHITLEEDLGKFVMPLVAGNEVKLKPNKWGDNAVSASEAYYSNSMYSETSNKIRKGLHEKDLETARRNGIAERPPTPSDFQLMSYAKALYDESFQNLSLGDLENIVKTKAGGLELKISEDIKKLSLADAQKDFFEEAKIKGFYKEGEPLDMESIGEKMKDTKSAKNFALVQTYQGMLDEAYKFALINLYTQKTFYESVNMQANKIHEELEVKKAGPKKKAN